VSATLERRRRTEGWVAAVRLIAVPFAIVQAAVTSGYPPGYALWAWLATGIFAAGAVALHLVSRRRLDARGLELFGAASTAFDFGAVSAYVLAYSWQVGTPVRQVLFFPVIEAALRYGLRGPLVSALATAPVLVGFEFLRQNHVRGYSVHPQFVTFQVGLEIVTGFIVGGLVRSLGAEAELAEERAGEAEGLRDQLGRRADLFDAANRCSRALASSLDLHEAFGEFIRELRGLVPFDRCAIVLAEGGVARIMATAGEGAGNVFPPGSEWPLEESVTAEVLGGRTVVQPDLSREEKSDVDQLLELGLRSRLAAPLLLGARAIGMLSLTRRERDAFTADEIELVSLLGRLVATAVHNIRVYEAERHTVEELRRLSALRADFVSLVSHELRSPMSAVIGAAQTLQQRWRELTPDQRSSFLSLIADETSRLAGLIGDVLDTSRIESGTFSYSFSDVDLGELVRETVALAEFGQDEVRVRADVRHPVPRVRGDRERLKQVLTNLIDNAVKYSPAGGCVDVFAYSDNGFVRVDVRDEGPGIARDDQQLIFEKFGRVTVGGGAKPGTGLGLFIARSIAEAHGGSLIVRSAPQLGATFTLELPL
jgi:signal transduction histidine kinase